MTSQDPLHRAENQATDNVGEKGPDRRVLLELGARTRMRAPRFSSYGAAKRISQNHTRHWAQAVTGMEVTRFQGGRVGKLLRLSALEPN